MNTSEKTALLSRWIDEAAKVTAVSHVHPDGDAAGSCTAMACFLASCRHKDAAVVLPDPVPENLAFVLRGIEPLYASSDFQAAIGRIEASDLIICLDFNVLDRAEGISDRLRAFRGRKVLIDHHVNPEASDFDLCFSQPELSSTCELLYDILLGMPEAATAGGHEASPSPSFLPPDAAYALMTGMTTDTNNFANSVGPGTLAMASGLLAAGVDRDDIIDRLYFSERPNRLAAQGAMLSEIMRLTDNGAAVTVFDKAFMEKYSLCDGETEGFVNIPLTIKDVRLSMLVREEKDGQVRVSIRSKKGVSARKLAVSCFHGGGHERAAGGKIIIPSDVACMADVRRYSEELTARFMQQQGAVEHE